MEGIAALPDEFMPPNSTMFLQSVYLIEEALKEDAIATYAERQNHGGGSIPKIAGHEDFPLAEIFNALSQWPDEVPSPSTQMLPFITDVTLQNLLRNDVSSVNRALSNGEWKAATVLAGSVVEALLLWALSTKSQSERDAAIAACHNSCSQFPANLKPNLSSWKLFQMVAIAAQLNLISEAARKQADLCRDFRNLIHPAKELREGVCDRGTALSAVAAIELVVRDLTGSCSASSLSTLA